MEAQVLPSDGFEAIENITAFWSGDWAGDRRLAWLYGILAGWDCESLKEFKAKWSLTDEDVTRLKNQRSDYLEAMRLFRESR